MKLEENEFNFWNGEGKNETKDFFPFFIDKCPVQFLFLIFFRIDMSGIFDIDIFDQPENWSG